MTPRAARDLHLLPRLSLALIMAGSGLATGAFGQLQTLSLDDRDPIEVTIGKDQVNDLVLVGALFDSPNQIIVFSGPGNGQGPFTEEIVVNSGVPFFALSKAMYCRAGVCYFTGVNGNSLNVELFIRNTAGSWIRQQVTTQGAYFNSDVCLTQDSVSFLAFDSVAGEHEVWRGLVTDLIFSQVAVRSGTTDGVFGGSRASIACDPNTHDFSVLLETDTPTPTPPHLPVFGKKAPGPPPRSIDLWIDRDSQTIVFGLGERTIPLSGLPADATETFHQVLGKAAVSGWVDDDGKVQVRVSVLSFDGVVTEIFSEVGGVAPAGANLAVTTIEGLQGSLLEIRWPPDQVMVIRIRPLDFDTCSAELIHQGTEAAWTHDPPAALGTTTGPAANQRLLFVSRGSVALRRYATSGIPFFDDLESANTGAWSQTVP